MSTDQQFFGEFPVGDKLRTGTKTNVGTAADVTVLNVASGGGIIHGFWMDPSGAATATIDQVKVTVDGAPQRTLFNWGGTGFGTGLDVRTWIPLPIKFANSCVIDCRASGNTVDVYAMYSVF